MDNKIFSYVTNNIAQSKYLQNYSYTILGIYIYIVASQDEKYIDKKLMNFTTNLMKL